MWLGYNLSFVLTTQLGWGMIKGGNFMLGDIRYTWLGIQMFTVLTTILSHTQVCGECNLRVIRRRPRGPIRCTIKFLLSLSLACSMTHDLEVNQMLVQIRPEYLTMEDRWGDIALLYLFWCNAPKEIIQFMVERYMTNYPQ
jgi:hypothetical protein